jgi:hypothetical protein
MVGEAKLGLMIGVVVVLAVALTYFRPEGKSGTVSEKARAVQGSKAVSLSPMKPADKPGN